MIFECLDSYGSGTLRVIHDHLDVLFGDSFSIDVVVSSSGGGLGWLSLSSISTGSSLGLGGGSLHLLGLGHVEALCWVVNLDFSENGEGVSIISGSQNSWVVDNEDDSVLLLESDTSNSLETLHTDLGKSLAGLLLTLLELWTVY